MGVPLQSDYFQEYDYVYWLGPARGLFSIDSESLVLRFDGDKVAQAEVVTD